MKNIFWWVFGTFHLFVLLLFYITTRDDGFSHLYVSLFCICFVLLGRIPIISCPGDVSHQEMRRNLPKRLQQQKAERSSGPSSSIQNSKVLAGITLLYEQGQYLKWW